MPRCTPLPLLPALLALSLPAGAADNGQLAPIVVTATRTAKTLDDTPIRTELVSRDEINRTHARNLKEALQNIPGLQLREIHGKSGYEVSLQGLTSDQVLVLIDGLPISASTSSTVDLSQYSLADVEHIEVIKGAASAQYGSSAMGGVINVITRRPAEGFGGRVTLDAGSYGRQNLSGDTLDIASKHGQLNLHGGQGAWRYRLGADRQDSDGFTTDPDAWSQQGDAVLRDQFNGYLAWQPLAGKRIWFDGSRYREEAEQRYTVTAPPNLVPQRKTEIIDRDRLTAGADWHHANGLGWQVKALNEQYDSHSTSRSNNVLTTDRTAELATDHLSAQLDLPMWHNQLWQVGTDLHREALQQYVNGASELDGGEVTRDSQELFVQNDILFSDMLELVLGVRYQDDSDFGGHTAPKAALRLDYLNGYDWRGTLRASVGQGYRVPNLKERHFRFDHSSIGYMVIGNPNLAPESSTSWQLGTTLQFRNRITVDINGFYNRVKDLIQTDEDNGTNVGGIMVYTYDNISRAETLGIESSIALQLSRRFSTRLAYTWTDTENLDTGETLTRRPEHMAVLSLDLTLPSETTSVSLRGRYQSRELISTDRNAWSPEWTTVDLTINQDVTPALRVFAGINNLFDTQRDFSDADDFGPLAGRFGYLGVRYQWGAQ